ncbi:hypothetical protein GCM10023321_50780 [Pseudonocardia eucalypti]|uniref:UTRA domain-containing protein n=1 Tax=Pseudonocardia eucalypti TaxID=648755 RepID=A0ABP9QL28_9PSEU|nr:hypothetical protein [Pseudonocardia eucalypti]
MADALGAHRVEARDGSVAVSQAALPGPARTLTVEHPELRCTRVDLDPAAPAGEAAEGLLVRRDARHLVLLRRSAATAEAETHHP